MKRVLSHILNVLFTVALLALSVSCTQDEMFIQENASPIEIIGRIPNFDPHYVNTKSVKTEAENRIYNMTLLIFNQSGVLEDIQKTEGSAAIFIVNKKTSDDLDDNLTIDGFEKMYLLANVEHLFDNTWTRGSGKRITDLETITSPNNSIGIMRTGFPMVGSTQLTPDMLNNQKIQIELEMLYAKVELNIKVDATQISPNNPQFQLTSCFVHNLPQGISLVKNINSEGAPSDFHANVKADGIELQPVGIDTELTNGESAKYLFYMPEHIVKRFNTVTYPNNISESEKQHYKPLFVENKNGEYVAEGKATYVVINGIYTDHQGHIHRVSYKVYLGANPIDNFEIERNGHYINDITIKGVTNSTDGKEGTVSLDHRVNIERNDYMIFMEREALLDCHYEVRPIHVVIDADDNDASKLKGSVRIEIIGGGDWIKLEKSNSNNDDASKYCDNGKRKYFTQGLLSEQNLTTECEITSNSNNCVWVYIDEYIKTINVSNKSEAEIIEAANAQKKDKRSATVRITYTPTEGDVEVKNYIFTQQCIYPIVSKNRVENGIPYIYYIEYQEEYLHNFDSYDNFGLTNYEGMEWGLDGVQLSHQYKSYYIGDGMQKHAITTATEELNKYKYDFYISEKESVEGVNYFPYNGWKFSKNIIDYLNNSTRPGYPNNKVDPLALDSKPKSAVEYCYNKNKRSNDGTITTDVNNMKWYMPSIDELEDIIKSAYTEFEVFQEKYYWSSQPSYEFMNLYDIGNINNATSSYLSNSSQGEFYNDNIKRARATRAIYQGIVGGVPEYTPCASGVIQTNKGFFSEKGNKGAVGAIEFSDIELILDDGNKARTELCRVRAIYKP
ncbi:MAG: DUF4906 domain-containing protein [Bacteroidaceae bacterium]|nr:DUF4906 domain-containing protein [Bacteroidaceae bacterium]